MTARRRVGEHSDGARLPRRLPPAISPPAGRPSGRPSRSAGQLRRPVTPSRHPPSWSAPLAASPQPAALSPTGRRRRLGASLPVGSAGRVSMAGRLSAAHASFRAMEPATKRGGLGELGRPGSVRVDRPLERCATPPEHGGFDGHTSPVTGSLETPAAGSARVPARSWPVRLARPWRPDSGPPGATRPARAAHVRDPALVARPGSLPLSVSGFRLSRERRIGPPSGSRSSGRAGLRLVAAGSGRVSGYSGASDRAGLRLVAIRP